MKENLRENLIICDDQQTARSEIRAIVKERRKLFIQKAEN
jgi:hypothetical protein